MLAVFQGSSSSCMSSTIGGAIRWADASLYRLSATDDEDPEEDATTEPPFLTPPSDIYSFGSVTLEVCISYVPLYPIPVLKDSADPIWSHTLPLRPERCAGCHRTAQGAKTPQTGCIFRYGGAVEVH